MRITGGEYLMGPSLMTLQDYYMATMFWAKMNILSSKRTFFTRSLAQNKRLDGKAGRRDMRSELQLTLESYLNSYPEVLQSVRKLAADHRLLGSKPAEHPLILLPWMILITGPLALLVGDLLQWAKHSRGSRHALLSP